MRKRQTTACSGWRCAPPLMLGVGRKARFFPLTKEQAKAEIEALLHRNPSAYGLNRAGWRLRDVRQALNWLEGYSLDELRLPGQAFLDQFKVGSGDLLRYPGLLPE